VRFFRLALRDFVLFVVRNMRPRSAGRSRAPTRYRNFNGRAQLLQRRDAAKMGECRGQRAKFRTAAEGTL
jgi:hypothetical protein